ncbi:L,D-transpeptidase family protein [Pseudomonas sp. F1_0610]|uniref:L,D-transpeptidase family protein n=1 Tax=Pseudomonas sp. F1_0610 TaxID=3114284 RepID=UPI0039C14FAA
MKRLGLFIALLYLCLTTAYAAVDHVVVFKEQRILQLMDKQKIIKSYHIALGRNPLGHKQQEGDSRTPEGTYKLDYINERSSYYRSMHISYPNAIDKKNAKARGVSPGGLIMVHGQPNGYEQFSSLTQQRDWTDGCIALTNEEMDEFLSLVKVGTLISIHP